jgi:hypothetical protein
MYWYIVFKLQCHVCKKLLNLCTKSQKTFNNLVEFLIGCLQGVPCLTSVCRVFHVWPVSAGCSMFDQCLQGVLCLTSVCRVFYVWPVSAGCSMFDQCMQGVPCLTSVCRVFHVWPVSFALRSTLDIYYMYTFKWSWLYGSLINNYLCNQCLSPLKLWVWILLMGRCTQYKIMW